MPEKSIKYFISYARDDEKFVFDLAKKLRTYPASLWMDQLDILGGQIWSDAIEEALEECEGMILVLSPASVKSREVKNEYSYALEEGKTIIPILYEKCKVPIRLRLFQRVDFTNGYDSGFEYLLRTMGNDAALENKPMIPPATVIQAATPKESVNRVPEEKTQEQKSNDSKLVAEKKKADKKAKVEIGKHTEIKAGAHSPYPANIQALLDELENPHTKPPRRLEIGNLLDAEDDPRKGIRIDNSGLPEIDWVEIPVGEFIYQDGEKLELETCWMSRYPVTNAQFQAFVSAKDGYNNEQWWLELNKPESLQESRWKQSNRPVEQVDWSEAMAFCRWLSAKTGLEITLPTEQQWEKAARGPKGLEYPWGEGYQSGYANIDEPSSEAGDYFLQETSTVGMYPQGKSPYGLMDMAGNVWEWCLNKFNKPDLTAPDLSGGSRVVRGGSWLNLSVYCRSAFRYYWLPGVRYYARGFRLCCLFSPIDH